MCCRMSNSIKHVWACPDQSSRRGHRYLLQSCCSWCYVIQPVHHVLHECVVGCPILSSMYEHVPIYHRGVGIDKYCNHVVLGASHPTCVSYIAWMSCRMSNSIKHVRTCPDLSLDRLWLYTFLHSLRSNFAPSRPLQLWFEAACEASLARDKYAMQSTPKSRRGRYSFICLYSSSWMISVRDRILHVLTERAWVRGVGIDFLLQSCCC